MVKIVYKNRSDGLLYEEQVYGKFFIDLLYGDRLISKILSPILLKLCACVPYFSFLYGKLQKRRVSQKKVQPFIDVFNIDTSEFLDPVSSYSSFNAFFIRKLLKKARPIDPEKDSLVFPADGRYLVFQNLSKTQGFYIKDQIFDLKEFLKNEDLFDTFHNGTMIIGRLCPSDYHRFHFPCRATPLASKLINGPLFSVNPTALKKKISILYQNKRFVTVYDGGRLGQCAYIAIGATCVGSVKYTYTAGAVYEKGDEVGYFEFGGSCVVLLFQKNTVLIDADLRDSSSQCIETYAKMGERFGVCF